MTAHALAASSTRVSAAASSGATIVRIARKELRDALANRWFILYTLVFTVLAVALSFVALAGTGAHGFSGFGRTAAGMLNLIMLTVPLMALTIGAGTIAGERERGMLVYLLAQPISRWELFLGKFLGLALALFASLLLGFGLSAAILAWRAGGAGASQFAALVASTSLLAMGMLAVGLCLSALSRRAGMAIGLGVFVWLMLVFISDLGLMAGTLVFKLRVEELFALSIVNPLHAFKMSVLGRLGTSLDVLGPAGLYASQTYGDRLQLILNASLVAWTVVPLVLGLVVFSRRSVL